MTINLDRLRSVRLKLRRGLVKLTMCSALGLDERKKIKNKKTLNQGEFFWPPAMWILVVFSCILIGRRRVGSDRQAVSSGARLAVLGSAREWKRAVLGIEFGAMQPPPPPCPEPSLTRRRPESRFWFSPSRELEEPALGNGRAEAERLRGCIQAPAPADALPRCLLEARTADSRPSAPAHATASPIAPAVARRRSRARRRRAKFRQSAGRSPCA